MDKKTAGIGKGQRGPGRPKGSLNKNTTLLKDALLLAAAKAGGKSGMVGYLTEQALKNPQSFLPLLGKVLPTQVAGDPNEPVRLIIETGVPRDGD